MANFAKLFQFGEDQVIAYCVKMPTPFGLFPVFKVLTVINGHPYFLTMEIEDENTGYQVLEKWGEEDSRNFYERIKLENKIIDNDEKFGKSNPISN